MTLEDVEQQIYDLYHWFHQEAPGVSPNPDAGELGRLWRIFDAKVAE